jgi:hypothetical protein
MAQTLRSPEVEMERFGRVAGIVAGCIAILAGLYFVCLFLLAGS